MTLQLDDTIAAVASPSGAAERGIVRVSGCETVRVIGRMFQATDGVDEWQTARRPQRIVGHLTISSLGTPLPTALMLWPTKRSYTGQPMAELHTIGSPPLLDAVLEELFANGARSANRGEFTMRAFLAGRIDLVQAEAVLGVIDAADHDELSTALNQLGGGVTSRLRAIRNEILALLGDLEAGLDFVEEDIEFISSAQILERLSVCRESLQYLAEDSQHRLPSGHRRRVVLAGLPNAGKSTLFNRLVGNRKAIVSPVAGTTRDYLAAPLRVGDMELELIDTAGWESASNLIMQHAQNLRTQQMDGCDLVVWCQAADLSSTEQADNNVLRQRLSQADVPVLDVQTRSDLVQTENSDHLSVSAMSGDRMTDLRAEIHEQLATDQRTRSELLSTTAARCRESLQRTLTAIDSAIDAAQGRLGDEITAMELRSALHQIGTILGEVYTDDILDHIFSNFCIGK